MLLAGCNFIINWAMTGIAGYYRRRSCICITGCALGGVPQVSLRSLHFTIVGVPMNMIGAEMGLRRWSPLV